MRVAVSLKNTAEHRVHKCVDAITKRWTKAVALYVTMQTVCSSKFVIISAASGKEQTCRPYIYKIEGVTSDGFTHSPHRPWPIDVSNN